MPIMWIKALAILFLSALAGVIGQLVLKKGSMALPSFSNGWWFFVKSIVANYYLMSWIFFGAVSAALWCLAVSKLNLSLAFPLVQAVTILLSVILARIFFHEAVSGGQWIGIFVILLGIFLVLK